MAGFRYLTVNASSTNRFRNFLALIAKTHQSVAGHFIVPSGFTGDVTVSGLPWEPDALLVFGVGLNTTFDTPGVLHLGCAAGADQWGGGVFFANLSDNKHGDWSDTNILTLANGWMIGALTSFESDGFVIDVTTGPPQDARVGYLAMRGGGFHVTTEQIPAATGTQALSGFGFAPSGFLIASAQRDALSDSGAYARIGIGAADSMGSEFNVWAGSKTGDVYNNQAAEEAALSLWEDADAAGPFQPALLSECTVDSWDADGVTLDWTTVDGTQQYYSLLAIEEPTQVGRWTYNHPTGVRARVGTRRRPKGLVFYQGDIALNGSQNETDSGGATIAVGVCDRLGARTGGVQNHAGVQDKNAPEFFVPQAGREYISGEAFGCYQRSSTGLPGGIPNNMRDRGIVTPYGRDHLLRLHVGP